MGIRLNRHGAPNRVRQGVLSVAFVTVVFGLSRSAFAAPADADAGQQSISIPLKLDSGLMTAPSSPTPASTPTLRVGDATAPSQDESPITTGVAESAAADDEVTPAPPKELDTLPAIMAKVWRDNPQVVQAEQSLEATGYDITAAKSGYLPYVQVQTALAQHSAESVSTLYVVLPLWSGGSTGAQVDIAKARQKEALAALAQKRLELGQQTLEAYFNVVQAQDQAIQWHNYVGALKSSLETIDRRASQGAAPRADVDTALSRLRQAQAGMEANRGVLLTNRAQLASLLNASPGSLAWPEEQAMLSDQELAADKDRVQLHPAHLAAEAKVDEQKGQARGAKASLWPELSLQHRRQLNGTEFDPSNNATLFVLSFQSNNGIQGLFGYRAEQQRIAAVQAQLRAADQQVTSTLAIDKAQLSATTAQLEVQYEAAKSSSALVESFIRQFEAGRKSWLEVLNAQREANDAMIQSITVRRNYWYASQKLALDGMFWDRFGVEIISDTGDSTGK